MLPFSDFVSDFLRFLSFFSLSNELVFVKRQLSVAILNWLCYFLSELVVTLTCYCALNCRIIIIIIPMHKTVYMQLLHHFVKKVLPSHKSRFFRDSVKSILF